MGTPIVPWFFLDINTSSATKKFDSSGVEKNVPKQQKSFVEAVNNVCCIPVSQLPKPYVKGDKISILILDDKYHKGVESCKHNLHGRIVWPKGNTPLIVVDLCNKLSSLWKSIERSGLTSLVKWYFEFSFSYIEDVKRVKVMTLWNLSSGYLKLFPWSKYFNPINLKQTSA